MNKTYTHSAPAKVNLNLHVVGRRDDGYHLLQSLVMFAQTGDELIVHVDNEAAEDEGDSLKIGGDFAGLLSADPDNLVLSAIRKFRELWPDAIAGTLRVQLNKNLPIAAGLGGGSSDAAGMLQILQSISRVAIDTDKLREMALALGADVPACLTGSALMMEGIGQRITPVPDLPPLYCVLANPMKSVSTARIFGALAHKNNPPAFPPLPALPQNRNDLAVFIEWLKNTRNDLAPVATEEVPEIGRIIGAFQADENCLLARMSGSGASVFALFQGAEEAEKSREKLAQKWPAYWVRSASLV